MTVWTPPTRSARRRHAQAGQDAPTSDVTTIDATNADAGADVTSADATTDAPADVDAGAVVLCGAINVNVGVPVVLQNATATFSQLIYGQFTVGKAIDGVTGDNLGWGVSPSDGGVPLAQTAAFETLADTPGFVGGTKLVFQLKQAFNVEHGLGRFRLAVTTANRSTFADGNEGTTSPGDVGASGIWTVLTPSAQCSTAGTTMTVQGDQSILVAENDNVNVTYVVQATTTLTGITGVRLEVLKDPSLPFNGPGMQDLNGNFVLSEMTVRAATP